MQNNPGKPWDNCFYIYTSHKQCFLGRYIIIILIFKFCILCSFASHLLILFFTELEPCGFIDESDCELNYVVTCEEVGESSIVHLLIADSKCMFHLSFTTTIKSAFMRCTIYKEILSFKRLTQPASCCFISTNQ